MHRHSVTTLLWLITDALIFLGSYILAYFLKVGWIFSSDLPFSVYISAVAIVVPGWLVVMISLRNYGLSRVRRSAQHFAYIAYAALIGMAGFALVFYFMKQSLFSRGLLIMGGTFSTISIFGWHIIFDQIQRRCLRSAPATYPLLVIGTNREAERLITKLQQNRSPLTPVAILDGKGSSKSNIAGIPVLGKLNKLEEVINNYNITHLIQCDQLEHAINLLSLCRNHKITYMIPPYVLGVIEENVPIESLEGQQVVCVAQKPKWWWLFR